MFFIKPNKLIFLILIAILTGSSMAIYSTSSANFWFKTIELVACQQIAGILIYFACLGNNLFRR
ncbi:MAG: hypothetical protein AB4058_05170 [Microcystaceae cyanobacterium]